MHNGIFMKIIETALFCKREENVLEHHSQVEFEDNGEKMPQAYKKRLACENWDAPVVVTTAVQP